MIWRILLLISLTSCVCGTFVVKVTQTSYQAEENHDITLEWMFTTKPDSSSTSLNIFCQLLTDVKTLILYHVHEGVESPKSQDGQFAGRVQCDKDALREGRIRLHVSRLRTDDSGLYLCDVKTDYGVSSDRCRLSVTAAVDQPKPQKPTVRPQPESWRRIGLYVGLTAAVLAVCAGLYSAFRSCSKHHDRENVVVYETGNIDAAVVFLRDQTSVCHCIFLPSGSMKLLFPAHPTRPLTFSPERTQQDESVREENM